MFDRGRIKLKRNSISAMIAPNLMKPKRNANFKIYALK